MGKSENIYTKKKKNTSHIFSCFRNFCLPFIQKSKEKNLSRVKCIGNKKISCLCCRRVIVGESIDAVPCISWKENIYQLPLYIYIYIYIYFLSFTFFMNVFNDNYERERETWKEQNE
jgi:hypothetical protein